MPITAKRERTAADYEKLYHLMIHQYSAAGNWVGYERTSAV